MSKSKMARLAVFSTVGPIFIWTVFLIVGPMVYIVIMSFMQKGLYGGVEKKFTVVAYQTIFEETYFKTILKSIIIAMKTTVLCLLLSYPFAYFITRQKKSRRSGLLLFIMLPFITSGLVRLYSWVILLNKTGIINRFLLDHHFISNSIQFLYNDNAVTLGLIYVFLPFAVLPIYNALEKIDQGLLDVSSDLGAKPVRTFLKVTLPLSASGVFASVVLVFVPAIGAYFIADILGGGKTLLAGNLIRSQFTTSKNWPFGAAISVFLLAVTLGMLYIYNKVGNLDDLGV